MLVLWEALKELGCWMHESILLLSRGKLRIGILYLLTLCWARIIGIDWLMSPPLFYPRLLVYTRPIRAPRLARQKPVFWGGLLEKLDCWTCEPISIFPWVNLGAKGSLSDHMVLQWGQGLQQKGVPHLPTSFNESGFAFSWDVRAFQLVSHFSQKEFIREFLLNQCVWGEKGSPGLPTQLSCWCHSSVVNF